MNRGHRPCRASAGGRLRQARIESPRVCPAMSARRGRILTGGTEVTGWGLKKQGRGLEGTEQGQS
jgi:hypothetical protein